MSSLYIKGFFSGKYQGEDLHISTTSPKKYHNIDLYEGIITDAEYIESYDLLGMIDEQSFEPDYLGGIQVKFADGTVRQINLINVVVKNVSLHETISREGKTFGGLTGTIYGKVDELVRSDQRGGQSKETLVGKPAFWEETFDSRGGCLGLILKLLGIFFLLYLLWCVFFGSCKGIVTPCPQCPPCGDNPSPVVTDTTKVDDRGLGTGELQMSLFWQNTDDLDLVVHTPNGWIYFNNKQNGGGVMDIDVNAGNQLTNNPVENIFWKQQPPKGRYEVYVVYFKEQKENHPPVSFTLRVKYKGREQVFTGNATVSCHCKQEQIPDNIPNGNFAIKVHTFEVGSGQYLYPKTLTK